MTVKALGADLIDKEVTYVPDIDVGGIPQSYVIGLVAVILVGLIILILRIRKGDN